MFLFLPATADFVETVVVIVVVFVVVVVAVLVVVDDVAKKLRLQTTKTHFKD